MRFTVVDGGRKEWGNIQESGQKWTFAGVLATFYRALASLAVLWIFPYLQEVSKNKVCNFHVGHILFVYASVRECNALACASMCVFF